MRRRLPLLVLLYVTLDFANPLMPGAVRFESGCVEVVQGDRTARSEPLAIAGPALVPIESPAVVDIARLAPVLPSLPWRLRPVRRSVSERSPTPPAPGEDH